MIKTKKFKKPLTKPHTYLTFWIAQWPVLAFWTLDIVEESVITSFTGAHLVCHAPIEPFMGHLTRVFGSASPGSLNNVH